MINIIGAILSGLIIGALARFLSGRGPDGVARDDPARDRRVARSPVSRHRAAAATSVARAASSLGHRRDRTDLSLDGYRDRWLERSYSTQRHKEVGDDCKCRGSWRGLLSIAVFGF